MNATTQVEQEQEQPTRFERDLRSFVESYRRVARSAAGTAKGVRGFKEEISETGAAFSRGQAAGMTQILDDLESLLTERGVA